MTTTRTRSLAPVLAALALALASGTPAVADWGGTGEGPGQFLAPSAIAVGPIGTVYVSDSDPHVRRIQAFTDQGAFSGFVGDGVGFAEPRGLTTNMAGDVFVADAAGDRIVKLGSDGGVIATWGTPGTGDGQFRRPVAVAADTADRVYTLDATGSIQQFTSDGAFIARWQLPPANVSNPADLAVEPGGDVLALDAGSGVVTTIDPNGTVIAVFGRRGSGEGQSQDASGIAIDEFGNVFIADRGNHRVQELSPQGAFITDIGTPGRVTDPVDVAAGNDGTLFVADAAGGRIVALEGAVGPGDRGASVTALSVAGVSGRVLARAAGAHRFVPVKGVLPIAAGWVIDARRGDVTLRTAARGRGSATSTVNLRAGIVTIRLHHKAEVELALTSGSFARCDRPRRAGRAVRRAAVVVSGGQYAVRGRDSVARSTHGSLTVEDACDGTVTRVTRGTATVTSVHGGPARRLVAGQRYVATHTVTRRNRRP